MCISPYDVTIIPFPPHRQQTRWNFRIFMFQHSASLEPRMDLDWWITRSIEITARMMVQEDEKYLWNLVPLVEGD